MIWKLQVFLDLPTLFYHFLNIWRVLVLLKPLFIYGNTMIKLLFLILMELWPDLMWLVTFQMFYTLIIHTAEYIIYTIKFKGKILQNFDKKILIFKCRSLGLLLLGFKTKLIFQKRLQIPLSELTWNFTVSHDQILYKLDQTGWPKFTLREYPYEP